MKADKDKAEEVKRCHYVALGADDNPKTLGDVNIPKGANGSQVKTQLGVPMEYILRRQATGEVIQNNDDVYDKVQDGDKLLLNPPTKVGLEY